MQLAERIVIYKFSVYLFKIQIKQNVLINKFTLGVIFHKIRIRYGGAKLKLEG